MPGALNDLRTTFCAALDAVGAQARVVHTGFELAAAVEEIVRAHVEGPPRVLYEPFLQADALGAARGLHARGVHLVDAATPAIDAGSFRVGLNQAVLGVAESGTLLFGGAPGAWGLVTVLPWVHIAVVDVADLYADLSTAYGRFLELQPERGSNWVWITGPSKTADIAHTLVTGIHGPNRLEVLIVDEAGGRRG